MMLVSFRYPKVGAAPDFLALWIAVNNLFLGQRSIRDNEIAFRAAEPDQS